MGLISGLIKLGLVAGASVTAYQASEKAKQDDGKIKADAFVKNFKEQAMENGKYVVDTVKSQLAGQDGGYKVDSEGENGYTYVDAEPVKAAPAEPAAEPTKEAPAEPAKQGDVVDEVFETMKEKAPEVIGKVQDFVEDVRDNAPEYVAKAQEFVEEAKEAVKKAIDNLDEK
jgi:uncharacterized protein YjbJ (UPF0337 family)